MLLALITQRNTRCVARSLGIKFQVLSSMECVSALGAAVNGLGISTKILRFMSGFIFAQLPRYEG